MRINDSPTTGQEVVEPLAESAPLQWQLAQQLCAENCRWYHGPRLYLRELDIIKGVRYDTSFLLSALGRVAREVVHGEVLISGTADYGMLAHLVSAFASAKRSLSVMVVDKCETPLRMNRWLGERFGVPVRLVHGDIFEVQAEETFDLICTHAFFGRFDPTDRRSLCQKWHAMLKPGGWVVTAHAMRRSATDELMPFHARQKQQIRERARGALSRAAAVDVPPEMIANWTTELMLRKMTRPVTSVEDVEMPLAAAGFTTSIACVPSDDGDFRMHVVAQKPFVPSAAL